MIYWYSNGTLPIEADSYEESLSIYLTKLGLPPVSNPDLGKEIENDRESN